MKRSKCNILLDVVRLAPAVEGLFPTVGKVLALRWLLSLRSGATRRARPAWPALRGRQPARRTRYVTVIERDIINKMTLRPATTYDNLLTYPSFSKLCRYVK